MHQQRFAGFERAPIEHIGPDGEVGFGDRGRLDRSQTVRDRQRIGFMRDAIFGIAAAWNKRRHACAFGVKRSLRSPRHDFARDFESEHVACARRGLIIALTLQDVGPVDARGPDFDEDFAFARKRPRAHLQLEHVRAARPGGDDCAHRLDLIGHVMVLPASRAAILSARIGAASIRVRKPSPRRAQARSWRSSLSASLRGYRRRPTKKPPGFLGRGVGNERWLRGQDLNLRPSGYEPDELPGCSTPRQRESAVGDWRSVGVEDDRRAPIAECVECEEEWFFPFFAGLATTYSPMS